MLSSLLELQEIATWLARLGIDEPRTRLGNYRRVIQQLAEAHARADSHALRALWPSSMVPLFEAEELIAIHARFRTLSTTTTFVRACRSSHRDRRALRTRTHRVGIGPDNTAFELAVTSRIVGAGRRLDRSVLSDVAVHMATRTILIECKRPQSETALERNVDDARRQLRDHYKAAKRPGYVGIIAIDVTRILYPRLDLLRHIPKAELGQLLGGALQDYSQEHETVWQKNRDRQTAAVLLRLNVMVQLAEDTGLTSCQQVVVSFLPDISKVTRLAIESMARGFVRSTP